MGNIMKDSSVAPVGLHSPQRQRWLMESLAARFQRCQQQRMDMVSGHINQKQLEEKDQQEHRRQVTEQCRQQRRETLGQWDYAEEKIFWEYEETMLQVREDIRRLAAKYRKRLADGTAEIDQQYRSRCATANQKHESVKHQPARTREQEFGKIKAAMAPIGEDINQAREISLRRLDQLPAVEAVDPSQTEYGGPTPKTIDDGLKRLRELADRSQDLLSHLRSDSMAGIVDSFWLPLIFVILSTAVAGGVWFMQPPSVWMVMVISVAVVAVLGFVSYVCMLIPLRRQTKKLYVDFERLGNAAKEVAEATQKIATEKAKSDAATLLRERDQELAEAEKSKIQEISSLEKSLAEQESREYDSLSIKRDGLDEAFQESYTANNGDMLKRAEAVANEITSTLSATDAELRDQARDADASRRTELARVTKRLRVGVENGFQRIERAQKQTQLRFPDWDDVIQQGGQVSKQLDYLPLGTLKIDKYLNQLVSPALPHRESDTDDDQVADAERLATTVPGMFQDDEIPHSLPVAMHRRLHSGMVVTAAPQQWDAALEMVHQMLWRSLSGAAGGRTHLTLIDPIGRGQHFTSFMALADHDASLVGHRVWTTESQIESRLGEIAQHAEDVLQSSLRERFQRVEDYNMLAGTMAEPYQVIAAVGVPEGLTRGGYKHLKALIESGQRCGVFVVLLCKDNEPWVSEMPLPVDDRLLQFNVNADGDWTLNIDGLEGLPFEPAANVPTALREQLVQQIGDAANAAARVEVPLQSLLNQPGGEGSTDQGIDIVIGSQGGQRKLAMQLGEGVKQHVLIAGKTGSGKSTLLHSVITSAAHDYTPDQLQFYLLDFKKGVEFKVYADGQLPHARVIGIESVREFGRSVLQRLDAELQHRGELFRQYSTQELAHYRQVSGHSLPRIMLVIDEFQELFIRDDRVAADCAMLLDRLVRQGRSFGIHVVLSTQSLAGAFSLPRATLGQMAVRVALQCGESDAALILSDDNTAARLLSRPGEAIYNDASGLIEGNQPFQVAWLDHDDHVAMLQSIADRDQDLVNDLPPPVVFQGNRPCNWSPELAQAVVEAQKEEAESLSGLLGEAVEIGPPVSVTFTRNAGRNAILIAPPQARAGVLSATLAGMMKENPATELYYFDGNRSSDQLSMEAWFEDAGIKAQVVKPREAVQQMGELVQIVKERGDEAENVDPIVVVVDPLDRFRDLRNEDSFEFSLDAPAGLSGGQALRELLKDGPPAHVYCLLVCGGLETMSRWLSRQSQHDCELRIVGRMNASDSSMLLDSPVATELSDATMLLYDEPAGTVSKFRQTNLPEADVVRKWLKKSKK